MMKKEKTNKSEDGLARMLNSGFQATQDLFIEKFDQMDKKFDRRFDKIENLLIEEQNRKIEKLESRIEYLENMLNLPAKN